jgi:hypothetical protein
MITLEEQISTASTATPRYKSVVALHARFERTVFDPANPTCPEIVKVYITDGIEDSVDFYFGFLFVNNQGYEGELVFELDENTLATGCEFPMNVFAEIAAYRLTPAETAKVTA